MTDHEALRARGEAMTTRILMSLESLNDPYDYQLKRYQIVMDLLHQFGMTERAAEARACAKVIDEYNCLRDHGKPATNACDDIVDLCEQRAKGWEEGR